MKKISLIVVLAVVELMVANVWAESGQISPQYCHSFEFWLSNDGTVEEPTIVMSASKASLNQSKTSLHNTQLSVYYDTSSRLITVFNRYRIFRGTADVHKTEEKRMFLKTNLAEVTYPAYWTYVKVTPIQGDLTKEFGICYGFLRLEPETNPKIWLKGKYQGFIATTHNGEKLTGNLVPIGMEIKEEVNTNATHMTRLYMSELRPQTPSPILK